MKGNWQSSPLTSASFSDPILRQPKNSSIGCLHTRHLTQNIAIKLRLADVDKENLVYKVGIAKMENFTFAE
jgi:hypothetical protein